MPYYILLFILISICACNSPKEKTPFEKFKEVDSSLNANKQEVQFDSYFDTTGKFLRNIYDSARYQIHVLERKLLSADPSGERIDIADSIIIHSNDGHHLYDRMKRVNELDKSEGIGAVNKTTDDFYMGDRLISEKKWLNMFFHNVPTVAAIAMVRKFKRDIDRIQKSNKAETN